MRLAIIDDHPLVLEGVSALVDLYEDLELAGTAGDAEAGLDLLEETQPEVALVDLRLGPASGLDLIREGRHRAPACRFLVLTSYHGRAEIRRALDLEVAGYVLKDASPAELVAAIRLVAQGRRHLAPDVMAALLDAPERNGLKNLTGREEEVLRLLGQGMPNREIARLLYISEFTVKKHVSQILGKLDLDDRTQAAIYACNHGLVEDSAEAAGIRANRV